MTSMASKTVTSAAGKTSTSFPGSVLFIGRKEERAWQRDWESHPFSSSHKRRYLKLLLARITFFWFFSLRFLPIFEFLYLFLCFVYACKKNNLHFFFTQIANHLVQRGVPAGGTDSQGATPLHYAACNHNLAFCRFLWGMGTNYL